MRKLWAIFTLSLLLSLPVMANEVMHKYVPNGKQVGSGTLSFALWEVYDATLYAPDGKWDAHNPYALSIHYFMDIDGSDIAERSVEEMQKQGFSDTAKLKLWHEQMRRIFPDVKDGTVLTAVFIPNKSTHFYAGSKHIGSVEGNEFGIHFFNIWLSEKTSEPALRKKLLGLS